MQVNNNRIFCAKGDETKTRMVVYAHMEATASSFIRFVLIKSLRQNKRNERNMAQRTCLIRVRLSPMKTVSVYLLLNL